MASFKQIMAMCLDGGSYAQISSALGYSYHDVSRVKVSLRQMGSHGRCSMNFPQGGLQTGFLTEDPNAG